MSPHKTVIINGRKYDAATGMPIADTPAKPAAKPAATKPTPKKVANSERAKNPSDAVHSTLQRSKTLIRRATKKPAGKVSAAFAKPTPGRHMDFARSPKISHFAPHPAPKAASAETAVAPVKQHPTVTKALNNTPKRASKIATAKPAVPATAKQVKDDAISKALKTPKETPKKTKKSFWANKWTRRAGIVAGLFVLIGGSAYLVYQFVPSVSVSFAAAQADIDASYPEYTPDGFSLKQPVTYSDGQVDLTFASNSNDTTYTITQKRSTWDSTAVLDSIVKTAAGEDYTTTRERGLTIYTYNTNAAWVNSGILYTINSNAALSGDQVRRIAMSL